VLCRVVRRVWRRRRCEQRSASRSECFQSQQTGWPHARDTLDRKEQEDHGGDDSDEGPSCFPLLSFFSSSIVQILIPSRLFLVAFVRQVSHETLLQTSSNLEEQLKETTAELEKQRSLNERLENDLLMVNNSGSKGKGRATTTMAEKNAAAGGAGAAGAVGGVANGGLAGLDLGGAAGEKSNVVRPSCCCCSTSPLQWVREGLG
jgi:hypothetical protein